LQPFSGKLFKQMAKTDIELHDGLRYRHDLPAEGGCVRGWKRLGLVVVGDDEKQSDVSG
jgi:hypothetical protein